ncbi:efflux RND transporter permease subunit [Rhodobacteraceae bacterium DSL-40]|uniref:efflux RND transporter permease subunit n=1 Tax=Amaricoccus sp. B4 TaxID=3368557 RepID=UPI000DAB9251
MALGTRVRTAGAGLFAYFARHPTAANLLMVLMLVSGLIAGSLIRSQFFPDVVINTVTVKVKWQGAGPEDVDQAIIALLEPALMAVDGVESSEASATAGWATIELEFEPGWDMSQAQADVESAVAGVTNLPESAEDPRINRRQWNDRVTDVLIWGPVPVEQLGRYADEFIARLYGEGMTRTVLRGLTAPVIRVAVPESELVRQGVSLREIAGTIESAVAGSPAGELDADAARLRAGSERREAEEIGAIVLRRSADGGEDLLVRDVAAVTEDGADAGRAYFRDGLPTVMIRVNRNAKGDAIAMQQKVAAIAADLAETLPAGVKIELVRTRAEEITNRLDLLLRNGVLGLALVVGLLFLFLDVRTAIWVAAGIPVAMAAAVAMMYGLGITLNMMSLFGLILCLGLVVDDAIVVAEHADWRHRHLREAPAAAAENAARSMALPVFSAMLTTVIAFFGLTTIGGRFGELIADIPVTVIVVLLASLAECFLILPHHLAGTLGQGARLEWLNGPSRAFNRRLDVFRLRIFMPFVAWVVRLRYPVVAACVLLLAQSAAMFIRGDVVWRFFAPPEQGSVTGNIAMLPGTTREETMGMVRELERATFAVNARFAEEYGRAPVTAVITQIGGTTGRGLPGDDAKDPDELGGIDIELIDPDFRPYSGSLFLQALEQEVRRLPMIETLSFRSWGSGPEGDALDVSFYGPDARVLKQAAETLKAALAPAAIVTGLEDTLSYDKTELILELTPLGERLGFSLEAIGAELYGRLSGIEAAEFAAGPRTATVRVTLPEAEQTADFLSRTRLRAPDGAQVPLEDIVSVRSQLGFSSLRRENGQRVVEVTGDIDDSDPAAAAELVRRIDGEILPRIAERFGVEYHFGGLAEQERSFLSEAMVGFALCLVGIYLTLAWIFESWVRPLVVVAIIPFGVIGTIWGHWQWGLALSVFTVVGLIGMTGIIINNAIVLVATLDAHGARRATVPAVVAAAGDRLRPILLTTLTTVLGLAPLLFERSSQALFLKPTVITLVYGLGIGGALVLILVPALVVIERDIALSLHALRRALRVGQRGKRFARALRLAALAGLGWLALTLGPHLFGGRGLGDLLAGELPWLGSGAGALALLVAGFVLAIGLFALFAARGRPGGRT